MNTHLALVSLFSVMFLAQSSSEATALPYYDDSNNITNAEVSAKPTIIMPTATRQEHALPGYAHQEDPLEDNLAKGICTVCIRYTDMPYTSMYSSFC